MSARTDAENLLKTCQCGVCLNTLVLPVTWSCGHSFCKSCSAEVFLHVCDDLGRVRCPSCRAWANRASLRRFATNNVLEALIEHVFPQQCTASRKTSIEKAFARLQAQMNGPTAESGFAGENNGTHTRGWEVIVPADEFTLKKPDLKASRNIVRDESDFAIHLSLVPVSSLKFIPSLHELRSWSFKVAMLEMEEDEADDGGFPLSLHLHNRDDMNAALIRVAFESPLDCYVYLEGSELGHIESYATRGIAEFDMGEIFNRHSINSKQIGSNIKVKIVDPTSGCFFTFQFPVSPAGQATTRLEHLLRKNKGVKRKPQRTHSDDECDERAEPDGESLLSSSESDELDQDEEDESSLDGFIVSDSGSPSPAKAKAKGKRDRRRAENLISDEEDESSNDSREESNDESDEASSDDDVFESAEEEHEEDVDSGDSDDEEEEFIGVSRNKKQRMSQSKPGNSKRPRRSDSESSESSGFENYDLTHKKSKSGKSVREEDRKTNQDKSSRRQYKSPIRLDEDGESELTFGKKTPEKRSKKKKSFKSPVSLDEEEL